MLSNGRTVLNCNSDSPISKKVYNTLENQKDPYVMLSKWLRRKLLAKENKRLPLKHPPLRVPAQELRSEYEDRFFDVLMFFISGILLLIAPFGYAIILLVITGLGLGHEQSFSSIAINTIGIAIA